MDAKPCIFGTHITVICIGKRISVQLRWCEPVAQSADLSLEIVMLENISFHARTVFRFYNFGFNFFRNLRQPSNCFRFLVVVAVVEKMKRRRSAKTSDTEEAMDTTEDKSPVTLSADR